MTLAVLALRLLSVHLTTTFPASYPVLKYTERGVAVLVSLGEEGKAELGPRAKGLWIRWKRIPPMKTIIQLIIYQILLGITIITFFSILKYNLISSHSYFCLPLF